MEEDCAVCLQTRNHPTQLPCGHIFCFLCMKGIALQTRKCALCRAEIPADYLEHPVILEKLEEINRASDELDSETQYQWYYEGRNGWWKYDERSNTELETAWNNSESECRLLLAGAAYIIDFESMLQTRRTDPRRRRRVKRDNSGLPAKGIAGIKISNNEDKTEDVDSGINNESESQPDEILAEPILEEEESTVSLNAENNELITAIQLGVDSVIDQLSEINIGNPPEEEILEQDE